MCGRTREGGDPTVDPIERAGGSGVFVAADASRWADIDRLVTTAVQRRGRLDVMVNNAIVAGRHSNGLLETEPEDWDAIMDVGLRGGRSLDLLTSAPARLRQPTPPRAA
ncbi:MAG TPA: SDR family oxidoreductase [Gaiellales bacterium]|jgi:NAD(P)-dependent dehydrogenase (short-subunit alcohol dehydrogenase family)|nr:SDR family oxidoreductase [Gaiellales bacterium]